MSASHDLITALGPPYTNLWPHSLLFHHLWSRSRSQARSVGAAVLERVCRGKATENCTGYLVLKRCSINLKIWIYYGRSKLRSNATKVYYNFKMPVTKEKISVKNNTCQFKWFKAYTLCTFPMPEHWSGRASDLHLEINATDNPRTRRWRSPALMEFSQYWSKSTWTYTQLSENSWALKILQHFSESSPKVLAPVNFDISCIWQPCRRSLRQLGLVMLQVSEPR